MFQEKKLEIMLLEEFDEIEFEDEESSAMLGIIACCISVPCK